MSPPSRAGCEAPLQCTRRYGMSLAECVVALALGSLVCACIASVIATQGRLLRAMIARGTDAEAMRVAHGVLDGDLRALADADVRRAAGDSIAARLFRGIGVPCGRAGSDVVVRWYGMRAPAPGKDSVVLIAPLGEHAAPVTGADAGTCATTREGDAPVRLAGLQQTPAVVLIFESGTYYLRDRALRYRIGSEGRQPITDERFASGRGAVMHDAAASVLAVRVAWPNGQAADTLRVQFANPR